MLLSPYRVLDLTDERGLLAGRILADLGADVVRVEPPGGNRARRIAPFVDTCGEPRSLVWQTYAANARSVICDIDTPREREAFLDLCADADVLIESEQPGVMAARRLGYEDLRAAFPRLIYVSITPFGSTGPKAAYAAADLVLWAAGGPLWPNREQDEAPLAPCLPQAHLHAAADAANGALLALAARQRIGRGQHVDVSVQQSVMQATLGRVLAQAIGDNTPDPRTAHRRRAPGVAEARTVDLSGSGPGNTSSKWATRDGYVELHLAVGPATGRFTNNLFAWLREEGACDDELAALDWRQVPDGLETGVADDVMDRARAAVLAFLAIRTKAEVLEAAVARKLLAAPVCTFVDLAASRQLEAREVWWSPGNGGPAFPGSFARVDGAALRLRRPAPVLGERDDELVGVARERPPVAPANVGGGHSEPRSLPLDGLKVVDFSWVVAGPVVGRVCADFGATVVRVETATRLDTARLVGPFHDGVSDSEGSGCYGNANAGKLGVALNLSRPDARQIAADLVRWADVVIESFAPGVMARWGLGYDEIRELNPTVVMVSTSLMGQTGPYATLAGYGNIGAALSGFQALVGRRGRPPSGPYGPYTDYVGPRFALAALLAALDRRRRDGIGCHIDVAQVDAGLQFIAPYLAAHLAGAPALQPDGNRHPAMAPHGVYPCAPGDDDAWVAIAVRDERDWHALARHIGSGLDNDTRFRAVTARLANADELDEVVARWTVDRPAEVVERELQAIGVPAHVASSSVDIARDPQLRARDHFVTLAHPLHGTTTVEGPRYRLSETPGGPRAAAPTVGQHTADVLTELLGYQRQHVDALRASGALT